MERLMFGQDFEVDAWSRFWRWNLIKICVWTCDMNSILGFVVPLAMFFGICTPFDVLHHRAKSCKWLFPESIFSFKDGVNSSANLKSIFCLFLFLCYWLCWIYMNIEARFTNIFAWKSDVGTHNSCSYHFINLRIVQIFFKQMVDICK